MVSTSRNVTVAEANPDWKEVDTGDFNGDGSSDILFQNSTSGALLDWQIANGAYVGSAVIAEANPDWRELGTGDFNGDGTDDILFQNNNSGALLDWQMANGGYSRDVSVGVAPPDMKFLGTGDFNGDGTSDILFQSASLRRAGGLANGERNLEPGDIDRYRAARHEIPWSTGDFNGDGTSDILFQSASTGAFGSADREWDPEPGASDRCRDIRLAVRDYWRLQRRWNERHSL